MKNYEKLCEDFMNALVREPPEKVFTRFFRYPERMDFISIVCSNLNILCINGEASDTMTEVYQLLSTVINKPELISEIAVSNADNQSSNVAEDLKNHILSLFKVEQLGYKTTSVEYVNGNLMYCNRYTIPNYAFENEFYLDKFNTMSIVIKLLNGIIKKNNDDNVKAILSDRVKVLKKLVAVMKQVDDSIAFVKIERKEPRLKITKSYVDDMLCIVVN